VAGFQPSPQMAEVRALLREASSLVPQIKESEQAIAAGNIAGQQVEADDLPGAMATFRALPKDSDRSQAVGSIAFSLADQGNTVMALQLIQEFAIGPDAASEYLFVANSLARHGHFDDALSVARLISRDPEQTRRFLETLMLIYVQQWKAGDRPGASATLSEALGVVEHEPETGYVAKPETSYAELFGQSSGVPAWVAYAHRPRMYQTIVTTLVLSGDREAAPAVVERIRTIATRARGSDRKQGALTELAIAQAEIGHFADAQRTARRLKADMGRDDALTAIATEKARQGDSAGALRSVINPAKVAYPDSVFGDIADELSLSGNYVGAFDAANRIKKTGERAYSLSQLALREAGKGIASAKQTADLAWQTIQEAKTEQTESYIVDNTVKAISVVRSMMGDFAGALEIINGPDIQRKVWPLESLVEYMVIAGKKDDALTLARSQNGPEERLNCLQWIAETLMFRLEHPK